MADSFPMHAPVVITDGGPWAVHDYACPVCSKRKAVLELGTGVFHPCDGCRAQGWDVRKKRRWWRGR